MRLHMQMNQLRRMAKYPKKARAGVTHHMSCGNDTHNAWLSSRPHLSRIIMTAIAPKYKKPPSSGHRVPLLFGCHQSPLTRLATDRRQARHTEQQLKLLPRHPEARNVGMPTLSYSGISLTCAHVSTYVCIDIFRKNAFRQSRVAAN